MKKIILCADDYGQNLPISQGITELLAKGKLSATSCMTNSPHWVAAAKLLQPYVATTDIGLHFNLTEGTPLGPLSLCQKNGNLPSLPNLLLRSLFKKLNPGEITAELNRQIDRFATYMGKLPDFIDGHQHIHQFPVIRNAIIAVYEKRLKSSHHYIRCVNEPNGLRFKKDSMAKMKRTLIYLAGGNKFKSLLEEDNIPHNQTFSGIYDFAMSNQYPTLFPTFLKSVDQGGLIMCHPGQQSNDVSDSIAKSRYDEYHYFSSDAFIKDCNDQQIQLSRYRDL